MLYEMSEVLLDLKSFLHDKNEPVLITDVLKWGLLNWSLEDWKNVLEEEELEFRLGVFEATEKPQWERTCKLVRNNFDYLLNHVNNNTNEWLYFDYKHLNSWFKNIEQSINWSTIGFPDVKPEDCTIWIGTKGAHTPCHLDCYGFNLVYQIYGKKLWVLFPPEENLLPSRIPYEESSIYSKLNFFSPNLNDFKGISKCRKIELNPGDILFVPHKWWHYVENLTTSISVNVWLPLVEDHEERFKESVVQFFAKQITDLSSNDVNRIILNPNMDDVILESSESLMDILNKCKRICKENLSSKRVLGSKERGETQKIVTDINDFVSTIPVMSKEDFTLFLNKQIDRFNGSKLKEHPVYKKDDNVELFEAITDPRVIELITNILLKK
ncbi:HSPB1-associated protein 1 isoform X2 [Diorhabda carinulata]|uniref:HSPB1-associated protein 1 isoform X2 n=1 Tax=Diorhabda carinulata TaxID=1163345 RepID=UPI0025A116C9|nr:HSPB1-associated protein 1 isoform X2 [Diorhabda carinulata]